MYKIFVLIIIILNLLYIKDSDLETYDIDSIPDNVFEAVEADSFWCLTNLLDGIQVPIILLKYNHL